jgi:hypothetical protein
MFPTELQGGTDGVQGIDSPFTWVVAELFVKTIRSDEGRQLEVDDAATHETRKEVLENDASISLAFCGITFRPIVAICILCMHPAKVNKNIYKGLYLDCALRRGMSVVNIVSYAFRVDIVCPESLHVVNIISHPSAACPDKARHLRKLLRGVLDLVYY